MATIKKTTPLTQADLEESLAALLPGYIETALAKQKLPEVKVTVPDIKIPEIKLPEIKVPEIQLPEPKITVQGGGVTKEELARLMADLQAGLVKDLAGVFRDAVSDALKATLPASSAVKIWNNTFIDTRNKKLLDELNRLQAEGEVIFNVVYRGVSWQATGGGNMPTFSIISYKLKEA